MPETFDNSLEKIAKGTTVVFIGIVIATFLNFVGRVLLARFFSPSEYGIFSLGYVILNVSVIISVLGLSDGATRQIAYYRGKNDFPRIKAIIFSLPYLTCQ